MEIEYFKRILNVYAKNTVTYIYQIYSSQIFNLVENLFLFYKLQSFVEWV
jgi:hypothetical protein